MESSPTPLTNIRWQYNDESPIVQKRGEIIGLIRQNQVLVICGETGSGKSTQLPKFLLEMGRGRNGIIGHTQPRRIAARSIAARIAEELETPLGSIVGYQVRFEEKLSQDTRIKVMTDGILLAETQSDRTFRKYDTIVIDEAHERSLNIDFLLGMLKRVLPQNPYLKLLITSATLDAKRFAEFFSEPGINRGKPVPIIEVSGRTYPIEVRYRPIDEFGENESGEENSVSRETDTEVLALIEAVKECCQHGIGDILIFLPTERDILEAAKALRQTLDYGKRKNAAPEIEILPLYARLPTALQQKIFQRGRHRRIVLATNVAESSLTVPGIRFVIDTGTARISRYSAKVRTQRLPIEPVSKASADQRAGRCGRIGDGVCIRLFSETDYRSRQPYTTPEIQRTNLASVILQTLSLRLGKIEHFPFLDPPRKSAITDGYNTLFEIGAIDEQQKLTPLGWKLSKLPVDPRIGKMILTAIENNCLNEVLIIAAVLEIQDPRERPLQQQEKADAAHSKFLDSRSDYLGYLKLWEFYQHLKETISRNGLRKACQQNFLSYNRMREWSDIHIQLQQFLRELKLRGKNTPENKTEKTPEELYTALHRSILSGNLSGIAQRLNRTEYLVCNSGGNTTERFVLWLGSGLMKGNKIEVGQENEVKKLIPKPSLPHWIIAQERIETSRRYLRTAAQIESSWLEPLAQHLLKRTYQEPHWDAETGYVHAFERVTLLGIVIVPRRRINFGPIDPKTSRDIFIQYALVEGMLITQLGFFEYNRAVLEEAKTLQDKLRNYDVLRPQTAQYEFYQRQIPEEVFDLRSLEKWAKEAGNEQRLYFTLRDLCNADLPENILQQFPDKLETFDGGTAKVEYRYAPEEEADGVTVIVPKEGLKQLNPHQLGWLVPGLMEQKIIALLKSLPKDLRRQIVPVPDTARVMVKEINFGQGKIEEQVARQVSKLIGRLVTPADFNGEKIPRELQMNVRVLGEDGKTVGEGRNLDTLRKDFGVKTTETVSIKHAQWNRSGLTDWDFGLLPEYIEIERAGVKFKAFPMLYVSRETDNSGKVKDVVSLCLADSPDKAIRETQRGIVQLYYLLNHRLLLRQISNLPSVNQLRAYAHGLPNFDFQTDFALLLAARCLEIDTPPLPRSQAEYQQRCNSAKERTLLVVQELTRWIADFLENFHTARLTLERNKNIRDKSAYEEAAQHFRCLTESGFLINTSWQFLKEFPRYFKAVPLRFEKLKSNSGSNQKAMEELLHYRKQYEERLELHLAAGIDDTELEVFRWMLEEYRVSLFAQQLGTAMKVSPQRLDKQFEKVRG
ncbi:MAG: ATP-dependent RNA helicase HrpA [Planctomycetaceae bacterium]|nr:ATP-dependent RNA helicase HrpA [Planctomycetaceae bacterium]